jgi:hypothetical protein
MDVIDANDLVLLPPYQNISSFDHITQIKENVINVVWKREIIS